MPPEIETFFQKFIDCANFEAATAFQKSWNRKPAAIVKIASARAAQRALKPIASSKPPPSSTAMAMIVASCGSGRPFEAMYPAMPSNSLILPNPEVMKISASRMRPTSAAELTMLGFKLFSMHADTCNHTGKADGYLLDEGIDRAEVAQRGFRDFLFGFELADVAIDQGHVRGSREHLRFRHAARGSNHVVAVRKKRLGDGRVDALRSFGNGHRLPCHKRVSPTPSRPTWYPSRFSTLVGLALARRAYDKEGGDRYRSFA